MFYFNHVTHFVKAFYAIMQQSRIDDSDLIIVEIRVTLGMGAIFLLYGLYYYFDADAYITGYTAIANSILVAI